MISVGELNENKNHRVMISALSQMNNKHAHYCVAGNGPLLQELTAYASELGVSERVHFLGYRRDVPALLSQANVFVLPSRREGLGMAAIEAMSFGLPLVSSNRHGINDYSIKGVTGYKHDPDDSKGFGESVDLLLSNKALCVKMGENCKKIAQEFSLEASLDCMKGYYLEILENA